MTKLSDSGFIAVGWLYLIGAIAVIGMLSYVAYEIRESGKDAIRLEWSKANEKEKERLAREATVRDTITAKKEAENAKEYASLDARYRAALIAARVRNTPSNSQTKPLSEAASILDCPDRQADVAERLERLEVGVLELLERGDRAIQRTITCRNWVEEQSKVNVE